MKLRKLQAVPGWIGIPVLLFLLSISVWCISLVANADSESLLVAFLDVGQGDAIFIESPSGTQVLVDAGKANSVSRPLSAMLPFYDRSLDVVVATHGDGDHIGGFPFILRDFEVGTVVMPGRGEQTPTDTAFVKAAKLERDKGARLTRLQAGDVIDIGGGAYLLILFPGSTVPQGSNESSLVAKLVYEDTSVLLTGDIPHRIERRLSAQYGAFLQSDLLKVAHHGSKNSSDSAFLSAVSPEVAVISAGADNSYGHPHKDTLLKLKSIGADSPCTCNEGTVVFESDGSQFQRQ